MGCYASIEVESPEEVQRRHDRMEELRKTSEASALGETPEVALKTLSEDEQRELVDSALAGISYFSDWRFGLGNRLYHEDPAPKMLAALEKAHAKFTDYSFDIAGNAGPWIVQGKEQKDACAQPADKHHPMATKYLTTNVTFSKPVGMADEFERLSTVLSSIDALFGPHGLDCRDIRQPGGNPDCWYVSKMSALIYSCPEIVSNMFSPAKLNHYGFYAVRLFVNGVQCYMLMDDYHPVPGGGMFLNANTHGGMHYFKLLEKLWIKLDGCYGCMHGGSADPTNIIHKALKDHNAGESREHISMCGNNRFGEYDEFLTGGRLTTLQTRHGGENTPAPEFMAEIEKKCGLNELDSTKRRYFATAGTRKGGCGKGLVANHAYSLLWLGKAADVKLMVLRNPWGTQEWSGEWSDGSYAWKSKQGRAVIEALLDTGLFKKSRNRSNPQPSLLEEHTILGNEHDGVFFMALEDFVKYFEDVQITEAQEYSPVYNERARRREEHFKKRRELVSAISRKAGQVKFLNPGDADTDKVSPITIQTNPDMRIKWARTWEAKDVIEVDSDDHVPNTPEFKEGLYPLCPTLDYCGVNKQLNQTAYCMLAPNGEFSGKEWNTPGTNRGTMEAAIWKPRWDAYTGQGGDSGGGWDLGKKYVITGFTMYCPPCDDETEYPKLHNPHPAKLRICAGTGDALTTAYRHLQTLVANPEVEVRSAALIKDRANCVYQFTFDRPVVTRYLSLEVEDVHDFKVFRQQPMACIDAILWTGYPHDDNEGEIEVGESDVIADILAKYRKPAPMTAGQTFTFRSPTNASFRVNSTGDNGAHWYKKGSCFDLNTDAKAEKETAFLLRDSLVYEGRGVCFEAIDTDMNMPVSGMVRHMAPKLPKCYLEDSVGLERNMHFLNECTFIPEVHETVPDAVQFRCLSSEEYLLGRTDDGSGLLVRNDKKNTAWVNTASSESSPVGHFKELAAGTVVTMSSSTDPSQKLLVTEKMEGADKLLELQDSAATAFIVHDIKGEIRGGKQFESIDPSTDKGSGMFMWTKNGTCFVMKPEAPEDWDFLTKSTFYAEKSKSGDAVQFRLMDAPTRLLGWNPPYMGLVGDDHDNSSFTLEVRLPAAMRKK